MTGLESAALRPHSFALRAQDLRQDLRQRFGDVKTGAIKCMGHIQRLSNRPPNPLHIIGGGFNRETCGQKPAHGVVPFRYAQGIVNTGAIRGLSQRSQPFLQV
jgi:hypothetical protein